MTRLLARLVPVLLLAAPLAHAATLTVDSAADDGSGGCTLREAVQAADINVPVGGCPAGDVGGFDVISIVPQGITLASPIAIYSDVIIEPASGTIALTRTGTGRVFEIRGGEVFLRFLTFLGGPDVPSGGVLVDDAAGNGATANVENCVFDGNQAERYGGAIEAIDGATVDVQLTTFTDNRVFNAGLNDGGGAIYVRLSSLSIDEATFTGNRALTDTDAGGGAITADRSDVLITTSTFENNRASSRGGGVFGLGATLTIEGSTFLDNRVTSDTGYGGGIAVVAGSADVEDVTVRDNSAGAGGGIGIAIDATVTLTGTEVRANRAVAVTATRGGGGIMSFGGTLTLSGGEVSRNRALAGEARGGGIYASGNTALDVSGGTVIEANRVGRTGGGIALAGTATATITEAVITGNRTTAASTEFEPVSDGGGIWAGFSSGVTLTAMSVTNNFAKGSGGGAWVGASASLTVTDGFVTGNRARGTAAGTGGGGVMVADDASATFTGTRVEDNEARADAALGGGVFVDGASASFQRARLRRNLGGQGGGGVAVIDGGAILVQGTEEIPAVFEDNLTGRDVGDGGGLFLRDASSANVSFTQFLANEAWRYGGGIWADGESTLFVANSTLRDNTARIDGGGIAQASGDGSNVLSVTQSAVIFNVAERGRGGGFFVDTGADGEIVNTTLHGNTARFGGGLFSDGAALLIESVTATANTGLTSGGGFGNPDGNDRPVHLRNTIVADNAGGDFQGRYASDGHNLIASTPSAAAFAAVASDQLGTAPLLGPLADNGGPTFSRLPAAGSPAVDAGDTAALRDQRGELRLSNPDDVGSVERVGGDPVTGPPTADATGASKPAEPVALDAAPNPIRSAATVRFSVAEAQAVTVSLVDATGRRVQTLYAGTPSAGEPLSLDVRAGDLAAGVYLVVLEGESVRAVRQVSVVR